MKQFSYAVTKPNALHVRPFAHLVREASRFQSSVHLTHQDKTVDLSGVRSLGGLPSGSLLTVTVEGRDEEAALAAIQNYFVENL